jgi:exopolysaccharide biosynthesis polyprenyl glycosylphosphotransferase
VLCASFDLALASVAVLVAMLWDGDSPSLSSALAAAFVLPALFVGLMLARGNYRRRLRVIVLDEVPAVVSAASIATMAVATLSLLINGQITDQSAWVRLWLLTLVIVCAGHVALALTHRRARLRGRLTQPVLILGAGQVGARVARRLEAEPEYGMSPIGFIDDHPPSTTQIGGRNVPVLGTIDATERVLYNTGARSVIVAFPTCPDVRVNTVIRMCEELGVGVLVVPRLFDTINGRTSYETLGGLPLLSFRKVSRRGWQFAVKHAFDRVFAALALVVLSPVMFGIALAIRLTSPGPTLYRQRRVGRDGKVFDLYKFRSMHCQSESVSRGYDDVAGQLVRSDVGPGGVEGDKRLTSVGRMLRKSSLDELPQFINVLKGEMSVIGPRPERPEFVEQFEREIAGYSDRHLVKSGITGWAQVHGLRGPTSLLDRTEWDNYYIREWSLRLDLKILLLTFVALFDGG